MFISPFSDLYRIKKEHNDKMHEFRLRLIKQIEDNQMLLIKLKHGIPLSNSKVEEKQ